ncbi:MAG TPA: MauE/DoxX family redox-associated membrane protein, partial [Urbifossiella sp.]
GLLEKAGYKITGELPAAAHTAEANRDSEKTSFFPLALIVGFLLGVVLLVEVARGSFVWPLAMTNFMAGWFLVFSFFKLLDVKAFADSYQTYDLLAARSRLYALGYPFIELALGIAFLLRYELKVVNGVTLIVMLIGTVGVVRTLISRRKIRCACLGAVFNLPMSYVTLAEDVLMVAMAAVMLVM